MRTNFENIIKEALIGKTFIDTTDVVETSTGYKDDFVNEQIENVILYSDSAREIYIRLFFKDKQFLDTHYNSDIEIV